MISENCIWYDGILLNIKYFFLIMYALKNETLQEKVLKFNKKIYDDIGLHKMYELKMQNVEE